MLARLAGVVSIVAMLLVGLLTGAAMAVEEDSDGGGHGPLPALDEVGTGSEISQRYFPEEAEEPVFAPFLLYPLLAVGLIAALVILTLYLRWQPGFEEERRKASQGRR